MFHFNKKKLIVLLVLSTSILIGVAAHDPEKKQEEYKNLKVLPKNISKDSMKIVMDGFKVALGVKCTFCHAASKDTAVKWPDFASDEKPEKDIARHMMRMTTEINKSWFNFDNSAQPDTIRAVTCITCHRGQAHIEIDTASFARQQQAPPPANVPLDSAQPDGNHPPHPENLKPH
jgi:hypothetical protein